MIRRIAVMASANFIAGLALGLLYVTVQVVLSCLYRREAERAWAEWWRRQEHLLR